MTRMLPWLLVLLLAPLAPAGEKDKLPITGRADPELSVFDEVMTKFLRDHPVPGAALAVAKEGRLVYVRGFGYADPDRGRAVLPKSRFRVASISKPITAAAILRLI